MENGVLGEMPEAGGQLGSSQAVGLSLHSTNVQYLL